MTRKMKQRYHLEPERGLLNDPNGLACFNDKYYVFFQWNRFEKNHSYKEWGYFTSRDLITWTFEGSALLPDQTYDLQGVYSGCGYVIENQLYLFYTGNSKSGDIRKSRQCLAVSEDGIRFLKKGPVMETPAEYTEHFRDPKVWQGNHGKYFMVVGGQRKNGKGAIAICRSEDGTYWRYSNVLAVSEQYEMIECPDLFELDGQDVLLFNPQNRDNEKDVPLFSFSAYKLGKFDEKNGVFQDGNLDCGFTPMDYGFDFYAPQTMKTTDGRRILIGWMSRMEDDQERVFAESEPQVHCLTLPRELRIQNGKLYQEPASELYMMLDKEIPVVWENENCRKSYPASRVFRLHAQNLTEKKNFGIEFHCGEIRMNYDTGKKLLTFSRNNWLTNDSEKKCCFVEHLQEIEVWADNSSAEVFLNGGEVVFSARIFPSDAKPEVIFIGISNDVEIQMNEIKTTVNKGGKEDE